MKPGGEASSLGLTRHVMAAASQGGAAWRASPPGEVEQCPGWPRV